MIQRFVDRRFLRSRYDSQEVVGEFATVVRSSVDLDELVDRLTVVVGSTFEPTGFGVWLDGERSSLVGEWR